MMEKYKAIQHQEKLTSGEAIQAAESLVQRYLQVLNNLLRIKQQQEETEGSGFARKQNQGNQDLLQELQDILRQLERKLTDLESVLLTKRRGEL